ncbi:MAG: hypothetical protein ACHQTE_02260 [Candidatus Saccharimonadales bacterium]
MSHIEYERHLILPDTLIEAVTIDDTEFLQVNTALKNMTALWSSDTEVSRTIELFEPIIGQPVAFSVGAYMSRLVSDEVVTAHGPDVARYLTTIDPDQPNGVRLIILPCQNGTLSWRSKRHRFTGSRFEVTEVTLSDIRRLGRAALMSGLLATASQSLQDNLDHVLDQFETLRTIRR